MAVIAAMFMSMLLAGATDVSTVQAPDSPIRLDHAATNVTGDQLDEFTVMAFVFRDGVLKARQVAPGRRTLDAHGTKYSAMVLDGFPIEPTDVIVVGVNQAQRVGSDAWWRAELQSAAEGVAAKRPKP